MAMNPTLKLSSVPQVVVTARVSRSGGAMPQSGDLQGESAPVAPGAKAVSITIDQVVP
jgi:cytochrome c-type biogenesis protein CcmH